MLVLLLGGARLPSVFIGVATNIVLYSILILLPATHPSNSRSEEQGDSNKGIQINKTIQNANA
jgi:hypothetical protein